MKLLLSFVNSTISLAGYDWDRGEIFWSIPSSHIKTCGICYHDSDLWVSSDNRVVQLCSNGDGNVITLSGPHDPQLHGLHVFHDTALGVVDTGHSSIRIIDKNRQQIQTFNPVACWLEVPQDAIHLRIFLSDLGAVCASLPAAHQEKQTPRFPQAVPRDPSPPHGEISHQTPRRPQEEICTLPPWTYSDSSH